MPRKPQINKTRVNVVVNGKTIALILHPPTKSRKSWYVYWKGLKYSKSTGQQQLEKAIAAAEDMVRNGGRRSSIEQINLSDDDFDQIQRRHYSKKKDSNRASKSLTACMEAVAAFREISKISPISTATPSQCEAFMYAALRKPKNWRSRYPKSKKQVACLSPNTVYKWLVALHAAFERINQNAGRKCIRGIASDEQLRFDNPWSQFAWIERTEKPIRQFEETELTGFIQFLRLNWPGVEIAQLVAKTFLWSWGRKSEISNLKWEDCRVVGSEYHFEVTGKRAVVRWFRIPEKLYQDLSLHKNNSPYVFAAFNEQLREFHRRSNKPWLAHRVGVEFNPQNLGEWFYQRVKDFSATLTNEPVNVHVFRKTTLQYARSGEDVNRQVAADAKLGHAVMMKSYVREADPELRQKSSRTFLRIVASLTPEVARVYGYLAPPVTDLAKQIEEAVLAQNWDLVNSLSAHLAKRDKSAG